MARIGVLGAGSWGTALAILLHDNGHDVTVWSIHEEEVEALNTTRRHERKLPGVEIPEGILFTTDMKETMSDKDVYISPDMLGIELGGALKNVIALAAGTADGLGYGDNTKAALITRGIAEIARLGIKMGGKPETFYGLTGIGDLIVTCASVHSRNRKAGYLMGQGYTMEEAMKEVQMVVEGVYSAKAALELSRKYQVEMPIVEQVNKVLFEHKNAEEAVKELMLRDKKIESDDTQW